MGRAFDSTAATYKFFWFLALLKLMPHDEQVAVRDVVREMIIIAWAPGALYRLSFGPHDQLQNIVRELQASAGLRPTAAETRVRTALAEWNQTGARVEALARYVPTRFLGTWFGTKLDSSVRDDRRSREIIRIANATLADSNGAPYALERINGELVIRFGPGWHEWILRHSLILERQTEFALARFLQARNPHVPGIVDKLKMPSGRKLAPARRMFERLRSYQGILADAYSGVPLDIRYAVDHVLPRSFVAHDLLWNLVPTSIEQNRQKHESLPDRSLLSRVARFHHNAIAAAPVGLPAIEDYLAVFAMSEIQIRALNADGFELAYTKLLTPLIEIASAQGFRTGWMPAISTKAVLP